MSALRRFAVLFLLLTMPAAAGAVTLEGPLIQGGLVIGSTAPGSAVTLDGAAIQVSPAGDFVFGFGREAPPQAVLTVRGPDGTTEHRDLVVEQRNYDVQRIDGLPQKQVTPPEDVWARIKADQEQITAVRQLDSAAVDFTEAFDWPARGRVSGVYGSQRILNGKPKRAHFGTDVAAPEGAPVHAAASGRVALVHQDMYYTGKTVMLDHGHGVTSVYIHMSKILVRAGDAVRRGQPIGAVGQTGRVTGPHLHWGVYWGEVPLDPALLVGPMPKTKMKPKKRN